MGGIKLLEIISTFGLPENFHVFSVFSNPAVHNQP